MGEYLYESRIRSGCCGMCGKPSDRVRVDEYTLCAECAAKISESGKRTYARHKENHECTVCGKQDDRTLSGKTMCTECAAKYSELGKEGRKMRELRRICTRCWKNDVEPGHKMCRECLDHNAKYSAARYKERIDAGLCARCGKQDGNTLSGRWYCAECTRIRHDREVKIRDKRAAAGICVQCGKRDAASGRLLCMDCLYKARERERVKRLRKKEAAWSASK